MHSRIFQIESSPIGEDSRIDENYYIGDHWFTYSIADYVAEDENRTESIEWLKAALAAGGERIEYFSDKNGEGFILRDGFHEAYFTSEFRVFSTQLQELIEKSSPEAYADGSLQGPMCLLNEAYDDEYGFYIDCEQTGLVTLNHFLRDAKINTRYYFGGTVDYHY